MVDLGCIEFDPEIAARMSTWKPMVRCTKVRKPQRCRYEQKHCGACDIVNEEAEGGAPRG